MKNYKIYILFLLSILSCQDAIDIEQPGTLIAENAFRSVDDLQSGLYGLYGLLDKTVEINFNALFTDEVSIGTENGGQGLTQYRLILNSSSGTPTNLWVSNMILIRHINILLNATEIITPNEDEVNQYNEIIGQTYALRAYAHFILQTYFTTDLTDDNALGAIAIDFIPGIADELSRNTNVEVFTLINSDLDKAFSLLSENSNVTIINKDFVTALRARMNAYRGNYTLADTYASQLLSEYPIANQTQFFDMFDDTDDTENIFKLERNTSDNYSAQGGFLGSLFAFINTTISGGPFLEMGRSLYNLLDDNDIRKSRYIDPTSIIDPAYLTNPNYINSDVLLIRKYPGSDGIPLMNDVKIFRSSEMLFIKAEALADAHDFNGVAILIKQLRDARFGTSQPLPSYVNETEAFGAILDERRLELAFEGHRWIDLKRLGARGNREIDRDDRDCEQTGVCNLSSNDFRYTLPIPLFELDVNSNLVQNPGY